ncbi:ABC transporter permease [Companilactobacillus huachuanensis]|uniref:ABC transporter permease n=1 Tax=Companilactobacillus huachuanensis TaxID=2559914 RepID=A0ABW1RJ37_9LACO|nr:ABC transporter permease subunit [Companilactobacillus huachuanensis]
MGYLYKQEIFKLLKKRSFWFCLLFIALQNIGVAIFSQSYSKFLQPKFLFQYDFVSPAFISLILIATSATIISTEFEYNTIKNVVMQQYSRNQILISKWLTVLTYSVGIYLFSMILSLFDKFIFFNNTFSLVDKSEGGTYLVWQSWLISNGATFITLWLILSIVFLLAAVMKKGALAVVVGVVGYFALEIISSLMFVLISKWDFLKWNPLNFLNYPGQLVRESTLSELTHLNNDQMLMGNIIYIILFMAIGLFFFSRKEV